MAMSASLSVPSPVIVNQPATCVLGITNSGASAVNVNSIAPQVLVNGVVVGQTSGSVRCSSVFVPVGQAVAQTGGFQNSIQVTAGGTVYVTFQVICLSPTDAAAQASQGGASYYVSATVVDADGNVFTPTPQALAVAAPQNGQPQPAPNASATKFGGALQFNQGANSALTF
jgi:hypothetical protein